MVAISISRKSSKHYTILLLYSARPFQDAIARKIPRAEATGLYCSSRFAANHRLQSPTEVLCSSSNGMQEQNRPHATRNRCLLIRGLQRCKSIARPTLRGPKRPSNACKRKSSTCSRGFRRSRRGNKTRSPCKQTRKSVGRSRPARRLGTRLTSRWMRHREQASPLI